MWIFSFPIKMSFLCATQMHLCSCNISLASNNEALNEGFNSIYNNEAFNGGFNLISTNFL